MVSCCYVECVHVFIPFGIYIEKVFIGDLEISILQIIYFALVHWSEH